LCKKLTTKRFYCVYTIILNIQTFMVFTKHIFFSQKNTIKRGVEH